MFKTCLSFEWNLSLLYNLIPTIINLIFYQVCLTINLHTKTFENMSFHIICADIIKHNKLISLQTILKILTFTAIKNNLFISYTPKNYIVIWVN